VFEKSGELLLEIMQKEEIRGKISSAGKPREIRIQPLIDNRAYNYPSICGRTENRQKKKGPILTVTKKEENGKLKRDS